MLYLWFAVGLLFVSVWVGFYVLYTEMNYLIKCNIANYTHAILSQTRK